jgi:hypothetical protein
MVSVFSEEGRTLWKGLQQRVCRILPEDRVEWPVIPGKFMSLLFCEQRVTV